MGEWMSVEDLRAMRERPTGEFLREWRQKWCVAPVEVQGHLLPCEVGPHPHEGECMVSLRAVRKHQQGGSKACAQQGCDRVPENEGLDMSDREFWMTMTYGCACGYETPVHLEYGVEGPPQARMAPVPCPYIAGNCPACGERWGLKHVRWSEDKVHDPPLTNVEGPRFLRPSRKSLRRDPYACGVPFGFDALG